MEGSQPEHYTVADFLKWYEDEELVLNPKFQRGSIWLSPARSYFIDSLLQGYPIPKLLLRTKIDRSTRRTIRDVVDGQQRLRTIIAFANDEFVLGAKAGDYRGYKYSDLDDDVQDHFLSYKLTCEQLINASDEDVLEVFIRINSYTVPVNEPELRNAQFDNDFSAAIKSTVSRVRPLWDLGVVSERARVRMLDQSLIADIYGLFVRGISDGDEQSLNRLYRSMNSRTAEVPDSDAVERLILDTVEMMEPFHGERIVQRPHFFMILATLGYLRGQVGAGRIDASNYSLAPQAPLNQRATKDELAQLNEALSVSDPEELPDYEDFIAASKSSTQRVRSRSVRFGYYHHALTV